MIAVRRPGHYTVFTGLQPSDAGYSLMTEPSLATTLLHQQIDRLRAGDRAAQEELVRAVGGRMRRLAQRMLRGYPGVRAAADTSDLLQNTFLRLLAALNKIRPEST